MENKKELENNPSRTIKDSLFGNLFMVPENFTHLYKECSGKIINPDDLIPFDLKSHHLSRPIYNDVSHLTKDNRMFIFSEHTSTPNPNMPARE